MRTLTLEEVLELHQMVLEQTGGLPGIRDRGWPRFLNLGHPVEADLNVTCLLDRRFVLT